MPSAIANTHPLKLKDGIDEKNAPMVHPKESVAPCLLYTSDAADE